MSGWAPQSWPAHIELARLLEALGNEVVATTEQEVRQVCCEGGWTLRGAAKEVRELIDAVNGDPDDPDAGLPPAKIVIRHEYCHKQQH